MEDDRNLVSLPPSPSLAFIHGHNDEMLTLCPISQGRDPVEKNTPQDVLNKCVGDCFYGWLMVWDEEGIHYSLWSPAQTIHLPALTLKPEQEIDDKILTSPPGNPDGVLILFETTGPSFFYCKIGDEQQWKQQVVSPEFKGHYLCNPIICNGRIYCENRQRRDQLGLIDIKPDCLSFSLIDPGFVNVPWEFRREYMVESCGEIFIIYLLLNGYLHLNRACEWEEVIGVHVYKLDLSRREWERVNSFKDRAFFLGTSTSSKFSCPATHSGIKGNHVYFQLRDDVSLYSYNMVDGTTSFSIPCPN